MYIMRCVLAVPVVGCLALAGPAPTFEENAGQILNPEVFFVGRAAGYQIALMGHSATIVTRDGNNVRLSWQGDSSAKPAGSGEVAARTNYFLGPDPAGWRTGVRNYAGVRYSQVYPGIDLFWHQKGPEIEHDFEVAPGADPNLIQLSIEGAAIQMATGQDLRVGDLRFERPRAYQNGREIACRYLVRGQTVRFLVGKYNRKLPLTIDPVLTFSTFLGGSSTDSASHIRLDKGGSIYVAGITYSPDFPVSSNAVQKAPVGFCPNANVNFPCSVGFISKLSADGSTLIFSTFIGGNGSASLFGLELDGAGNICIGGSFQGSGFPNLKALPGYTIATPGSFVAKLSGDGSSLLFVTQLPLTGTPDTRVTAMALDATGAFYVAGESYGGVPNVNAFQGAKAEGLVYRTSDAATHWQAVSNGLPDELPQTITTDPSNPQTLYLGMNASVYKSVDGGLSWVAIQRGTPPGAAYPNTELYATSIAVDPTQSQTVYVGTLINGIYKSTDGGLTFTSSWSGASRFVRTIAIEPLNPNTIYEASDVGVYKSVDAGATWQPTGLINQQISYFVNNVVLDPTNPAVLYAGTQLGVMKSVDAGVSWSVLTSGFLPQSFDVRTLAIDPVNPQILYASTNVINVPYRTTDGGAHWTAATAWNSSEYANALLVDRLIHTRVWAATSGGLLLSTDSGLTWNPPPRQLTQSTILALAQSVTGTLYAADYASEDAFAMKIDAAGSKVVYSTYLGGHGNDIANGIAVDSAGRAYLAGMTDSFDFPGTAGHLQPDIAGKFDGFVAVLDPTGSQLLWSTYLGGSGTEYVNAIALDPAGNIHLAGSTDSLDFPLAKAAQTANGGGTDAFVTTMKGDGSLMMMSTYRGQNNYDSASAVGVDSAGNTYAAGSTESGFNPVHAWVSSWNGQTGALIYDMTLAGSHSDSAAAITVDNAGNAYVAGSTNSFDFPTRNAFQPFLAMCAMNVPGCFLNPDAFVARISSSNGTIAGQAVANAASYAPGAAPGEIVAIFGTNLSAGTASANSLPLPLQLSDVRVAVNGIPAPLFYASPRQLNAQIPFDTKPGPATMQIISSSGESAFPVAVSAAAPGIFTLNSQGTGAGAIEHGLTGQLVSSSNPATAGEIVAVYCTGLGGVNGSPVTGAAAVTASTTLLAPQVLVGGESARVTYSGLVPGLAGAYQINVVIPADMTTGMQTMQVVMGTAASNVVTLAVR